MRFAGPDGEITLSVLSDGRLQLIADHAMLDLEADALDPGIDRWCPEPDPHERRGRFDQRLVDRSEVIVEIRPRSSSGLGQQRQLVPLGGGVAVSRGGIRIEEIDPDEHRGLEHGARRRAGVPTLRLADRRGRHACACSELFDAPGTTDSSSSDRLPEQLQGFDGLRRENAPCHRRNCSDKAPSSSVF